MAVTSIVTEFSSRLHALGDAVRAKAHVSGSMTVSQMTQTVLSMDAGEDLQAIIEGQPISLYNRASRVRPEAFMRYYSITGAEMPHAVEIGYSAFAQCTDLAAVSFPLAETVGSSAFYGCTSLSEVSLPAMTHMYQQAFYGCTDLNAAFLPESIDIPTAAFMNCYDLQEVHAAKASIVYQNAFSNCSELTEVDIPLASQIQSSAFLWCQRLSEVYLPALASVSNYAFGSCTRLMAMHLEGVKSVPSAYNGITGALNSTPLYNLSTYTGGYGSIYVPSSLFAAFKSTWAAVSNRIVSMDAIAGSRVSAVDASDLVSPSYCALQSSASSDGVATFDVGVEATSQYKGFCVALEGLEPGKHYIVEIGMQFAEGTTFSTSYRVGYTVESSVWGNYSNYSAWPDNIARNTDAQSFERPWYATSDKAWLSLNLSGLANAATSLTLSVGVSECHWEES